MSKKHYVTRMKERIAELEKEVRTLVLQPDSMEAQIIKKRTFFERDVENAYWAGDTTRKDGGGDGIFPQMHKECIDELRANADRMIVSATEDAYNKLIEYCRHQQKDYIEGDGKISGLTTLAELLQQGVISVWQYVKVIDAVEYYNVPYEIKIISDEKVSD